MTDVSPVYKLYQTSVKTTFRVWFFIVISSMHSPRILTARQRNDYGTEYLLEI
jgi:hypothetical protein